MQKLYSQEKELFEYLKEFKATNPKNMMVLSILATIHTRLGDHTAAINVLEQGLAEDSNWVQGYTALAFNYRAKNDFLAAIDSFERGLKALPNSSLLKMLLASSYGKIGNKAVALKLYEEVLVTNPAIKWLPITLPAC